MSKYPYAFSYSSPYSKPVFRLLLSLLLAVWTTVFAVAQNNVVTYAGGSGNEKFNGILALSDGSLLVSGQANDLAWLPGGVTVTTLGGVNQYGSQSTTGFGFVMRVSADLQTILSVVRFPDNTVRDVFRIKTNGLPNGATQDIYISGSRDTVGTADGYYIARLNNNFINGTPTGVTYYRIIDAPARNGGSANLQFPSGTESAYKQTQPWDVTSDGRVIYASGSDFTFDRSSVQVMNRLGVDTLMDYFYNHTPGWTGVPASSFLNTTGNPVFDLKSSSLSFKYSNSPIPGAFRSSTQAMFDAVGNDENGNPGRTGSSPADAFFNGFQAFGGAPIGNAGPGYTGYSYNPVGGNWTGRIGSIAIDRRNNHFYIGASFSVSSISNQQNLDDAEPAVMAFQANGLPKWWARLHKEDGLRSSAQQHVEGLELDYVHNQLVVLGRTRGDSPNNFWKGNELKMKQGGNGYQNSVANTSGPGDYPDFGWLGKYTLADGKIQHSSYIGELESAFPSGPASSNPNYDGFPDLNKSNTKLGGTVITNLAVDQVTGNVVISGTASRTMTTRNAYQKMFKPRPYQFGGGLAANNSFVRIYNSTLDTVTYSSLLKGLWNPENGNGSANNTFIRSVLPTTNGLFAVGFHDGFDRDLATLNVPAWGNGLKNNVSALFAKLDVANTVPGQPDSIVKPADLCTGTTFQFSVPAVPSATSYLWVIEATGWTGTSTTNSISLERSVGASSGYLSVYALNGAGISLGRTTFIPSNNAVTGPASYTFPPKQCSNQTQTYYVGEVAGATSYNWQIVGTGCSSWQLANTTTSGAYVNISSGTTITNPCSLQVVANGCSNSSTPVLFPLPTSGVVPNPPVFVGNDPAPCVGIPKVYSVQSNANAERYVWTVSGNGFSGSSTTSSIEITASLGALNGSISVVAVNQCGNSALQTLALGNAINDSIPRSPASISGPISGFCLDDTLSFSAAPVPNATFYNWYSNQALWSIVDPNANQTNLYIPQAGGNSTGLLFVEAINSCGRSNPASILIRRGIPDIPGSESILPSLSGGICEGTTVTFSINPVFSTTSYEWIFPTGWTINGSDSSNSVSVTAGTGAQAGNIKVKAFNSCGYDSLSRTTPVLKTNAATFTIQPSDGNGNIDVCAGSSKMFYIQGSFTGSVNTFYWTTPTGVYFQNASAASPSFDTVRISASEAALTGSVTVIMNGDQCGSATAQFKRGNPGAITGLDTMCANPANQTYTIAKVLGATSYEWVLEPANAGVLTSTDTTASVNWDDAFAGVAVVKVRTIESCGPSLYSSISVAIGAPNAIVQTPGPVCGNTPVTLQAFGGNLFNWYDAATGGNLLATNNGSYTVTVSAPTTYYVTIISGTCESAVRTPVSISISEPPPAPPANNVSVCGAGSVTMTVNGPGFIVFSWYSVPTGGTALFSGQSFTTTITATDTFYVSYVFGGCESQRRMVIASVNPLPTPTAPNVTVCANSTFPLPVTLTAGGATGTQTYKWFDAETGGTLLGTGSPFIYTLASATNTTVWVALSEDTCLSPVRKAVTISVSANPPGPSTTNGNRCGPGVVNLSATSNLAGAVFEWYEALFGGTSIFTGPVYSPNLTQTDTFYVRVVVGGCQSSRTRVIGRIRPLPSVPTATVTDTICGTGPVALSATVSVGDNAVWYDVPTGGNLLFTGVNFAPTISDTTRFYVATLGANGCESDRIEVVALSKPTASEPVAPGVGRCGPGSLTLTASANPVEAVLNWFDAQTGGSLLTTGSSYTTPSLTTTTTYYVSATLGDCETARVPVIASINSNTPVPQVVDGTRCGPGAVLLSASSGIPNATISWYDSQTATVPLATGNNFTTPVLSVNTTYYATASLPGCESDRVAVQATLGPRPEAPQSVGGNKCGPGVVTLTASTTVPNATLNWYDSQTSTVSVGTGTSFNTPFISATTTYYVGVSLPECESDRVAAVATINPGPDAPQGTDVSQCGPGVFVLTASTSVPNATIFWYINNTNNAPIASGSSFTTPNLTAETSYFASVSLPGCESNRTEIKAIVVAPPSPPVVSGVSACAAQSIQLNANTGANGARWYESQTSTTVLSSDPIFSVSVASVDTFWVSAISVKGAFSCESSTRSSLIVTNNPKPPTPIGASVNRCGPGEASLIASGAPGTTPRYAWWEVSSGGTQIDTNQMFKPNVSASRSYFVSITDSKGCVSDRHEVSVLIVTLPVATAKAEPSSVLIGEVSKLTATGGGTYSWTPTTNLSAFAGPTTDATPQETTTYKVKVNLNGCIDSAEVTVEVLLTDEVPNIFTPNGDNEHEFWEVPGITAYPNNKVQIFNRWGSKVFDAAPYKNDWTGGSLPDGTYYYTLEYGGGKSTQTGTVTIVRK